MSEEDAVARLGIPVERVRVNLHSGWVFVKLEGKRELAAPVEGIEEMREALGATPER